MNPENSLKRRRWPWVLPVAAFLLGLGLGWWTIHSKREPLPIPTSIAVSTIDHMVLDHPLPGGDSPALPANALRLWLFPNADLDGAPLAEVVMPPAFDLQTPWLKELLAAKLPNNPDNIFAVRMRGEIRFSSGQTKLHIHSDNGFRICFRNSAGEERRIDNWVNDVTDDFEFEVSAEPGRYEIEIDYFNGDGDAHFRIWADSATIQFLPVAPPPATPS